MGDQDVDLEGGHADRTGQHFAHDFTDRRIAPGRDPLVAVTFARETWQLKKSLGHARYDHTDRQAKNPFLQSADQVRGQKQQAGDHHQIEHDRPQGGDEEVAAGIGHADKDCSQACQQHVREHQPQQFQHQHGLAG